MLLRLIRCMRHVVYFVQATIIVISTFDSSRTFPTVFVQEP